MFVPSAGRTGERPAAATRATAGNRLHCSCPPGGRVGRHSNHCRGPRGGRRRPSFLWRLKNRVVDIIQKTCMVKRRLSVVCLEWLNPLMASGHWIPEMVQLAGGQNLFGEPGKAAPRLEWKHRGCRTRRRVLTPCGFNLARTRSEAKILESQPGGRTSGAVKTKNVFLADGNAYSLYRPGPRVVESPGNPGLKSSTPSCSPLGMRARFGESFELAESLSRPKKPEG